MRSASSQHYSIKVFSPLAVPERRCISFSRLRSRRAGCRDYIRLFRRLTCLTLRDFHEVSRAEGPKKTLMKNRGEGGVGHQTADEGCLSRVTIGSEGPLFKSHEDSSAGEHRDTGSLFICDRGFLSCMHQTSRRVVSAKGTIQHAPRRNFRISSLLPLQSFGMRIVGPRVRTLRRNS